MGQTMKLTTNPKDRKDQRDRTQNLIKETESMDKLQTSAPQALTGSARFLWTQLVPELNSLGYVKQADKQTVEMLCINYQMLRDAYNDIKEHGQTKEVYRTVISPVTGEIVSRDFMGYKRNPSTQILDSATSKVKTLSESLGLTPASRASLLNISDTDEDEPSLKELLSGGDDF